jgi:hypothetical protein
LGTFVPAHNLTMVQAFRSNTPVKVRFALGMTFVVLTSMCLAFSLSRVTSPRSQPTELDMEHNDAEFLLNSLPPMASAPDPPVPAAAKKAKKAAKDDEPSSETSIMQHDVASLKHNLKVHLEKETSDHIQLSNLNTDKDKAILAEQTIEAKIAAEKIQLNALEGHAGAAHGALTGGGNPPLAGPLVASKATEQSESHKATASSMVTSAASDRQAQSAMVKALKSVQVPSKMKSKVSSDIRKVRNVLLEDSKQKEALARIEMKISNMVAKQASDKASLAQVTSLRAKLKGAAQILKAEVVQDASILSDYSAKQDQLAPIVRQDEVRDKKLQSLVSAISRKSVLRSEKAPVKTSLLEFGPVILTELAQSVAEVSHNVEPTDLTFSSLADVSVNSIKAEMSANEASLAKVRNYIKTVDSEERAFRQDLRQTQRQEIPIRAGIKAMADI